MTFRAFTVVFMAGFLLTGDPGQGQTKRSSLLPFDRFVQEVAGAEWTDFQQRTQTQTKIGREFAAMKEYLLSLYEGVHVTHSFELEGKIFDCVPFAEQPSVRLGLSPEALSGPPSPPPLSESGGGHDFGRLQSMVSKRLSATPQARSSGRDRFGMWIGCDRGSIPMRRITLDETTQFPTLRQFFDKGPNGAGRAVFPYSPESKVAAHYHAIGEQVVANLGASSWINLWSPNVPSSDLEFSLSQQWIGGSNYGQGPGQTVEGGWHVVPLRFGDSRARLFVYWTADDYHSTGCYDLECPGFVQTNGAWVLGAGWSTYSTPGGPQYYFEMQWQLSGGNWWLYLQGQAVGYYPTTIYRGGPMTQNAEFVQFGGETYGDGSWPPMGSGAFASAGLGQAAFHYHTNYVDAFGGGLQPASLQARATAPSCYSAIVTAPSTGGYLFFGGPGGTSCQ